MQVKINIDKKVEQFKCPSNYICSVATTCYEELEREHICLNCWKQYCKENNIEVDYGEPN